MGWHDEALCRGQHPSRFYLDVFSSLALATCEQCNVRPQCQEAGLKEFHGVWGGLTADQRVRVREKRKRSKVERAA